MKLVFLTFLSVISIGFSPAIFAADFEGETEFTHYDLQGFYRVTCFGGGRSETAYHQCRGYLLDPFSFGYFTHDTDEMVDRVHLSTVNKDGKTINKRSDWNAEEGRSQKRINLWVKTLFQRPLLEIGDNQVSYRLTSSGEIVDAGEFQVMVHDGGVRTCRDRSTTTGDMNLCESYSRACDEYFRMENNCE